MNADCYPVTVLPHISALYRDYVTGPAESLAPYYSPHHLPQHGGNGWMRQIPGFDPETRAAVTALLTRQNLSYGASAATHANLQRLAEDAAAVVTGQQVGLFGGPLLTLLKAATAIRLAAEASRAGRPHVPIFWLATEDHDFDEVNQATILCGDRLQTLRLPRNPAPGNPVGNLPLGDAVLPLLAELERCLGKSCVFPLLASLYTPTATFASAFAGLLARIFGEHGLIVMDASSRPWHALARTTLRAAIEHADALHAALLERSQALEQAGYHAQVMVAESSSLLFLIDDATGVRHPLKKNPGDASNRWSAGSRQLDTMELLAIVDETPERISPNALLRPVFQDTLLPTSVYVGGPAEIAYFAQSQVLYQYILGRTTPIFPRFSATLIEPRIGRLLARHQLALTDIFSPQGALEQRLAARHIPATGKRKLAKAGNALDRELQSLAAWMYAQDEGLGHAADVAASKMLYQMNRLRRLSARHQLQRAQALQLHAERLTANLYPRGHLQERVLAGASFLAKYPALPDLLVEAAQPGCSGHTAIQL